MNDREFDQAAMVHRLPHATIVDRVAFLTKLATGRRVFHVGFVDTGCREMQERAGTWLHAHLATNAKSLTGLDVNEAGVQAARQAGLAAYVVDCCDPVAVQALGLEPADLVIAGEIIEHLDTPGPFLDAIATLVRPDGLIALTTPNASGLGNALGAVAGFEVNHPDHVTLFSYRTLSALLGRHGWSVTMVHTYVSRIKPSKQHSGKVRLMNIAGAALRTLELTLGRLHRPFVADGLIIVARRVTQ